MPTAFSAICEVHFVPGLLRFHKDMSYFSFILPLTPNYMILMLFFEIHFEICFYSLVSLLTVRPILFIWDFKKQSIPFCFVFLKVLLGGFKCLGWTTNSRRGQIVYIYLYAFQSWSLLTLSSIRLVSVLACEMFRYVFRLSHHFLVIEIWFSFTEPVAWLLPRVTSACVSVCASVCVPHSLPETVSGFLWDQFYHEVTVFALCLVSFWLLVSGFEKKVAVVGFFPLWFPDVLFPQEFPPVTLKGIQPRSVVERCAWTARGGWMELSRVALSVTECLNDGCCLVWGTKKHPSYLFSSAYKEKRPLVY